jgi:hypothetical protein
VSGHNGSRQTRAPIAEARAAKNVLRAQYRDDARINGVGITGHHDRYAVRVNVVDAAAAADVPDEVDGVPVEVVVVGRIRATG